VLYRVSITFFPDYKHLLQENYMEYFQNVTQLKRVFFLENNLSNGKKNYVCIPCSFLLINVCNQGKTLCSPCIIKLSQYVVVKVFYIDCIMIKMIKVLPGGVVLLCTRWFKYDRD